MSFNEEAKPCDSNDGFLLNFEGDENFVLVPCKANVGDAEKDLESTPEDLEPTENGDETESSSRSPPAETPDPAVGDAPDNGVEVEEYTPKSLPKEDDESTQSTFVNSKGTGEMSFNEEAKPCDSNDGFFPTLDGGEHLLVVPCKTNVGDAEEDSESTPEDGKTTENGDETEISPTSSPVETPDPAVGDAPDNDVAVEENTPESLPKEDDESTQEFYSCNFDRYASPSDVTKLDLVYDYELHWSSELAGSASQLLSNLEDAMLKDLAEKTGLLACQSRRVAKTRRALRNTPRRLQNENGSIVALGSGPKDESIASVYECQIEVELDEAATCTPLRGHMTAWLSPDASKLKSEEQILSLIQNGMENDAYTSDAIKKVSYIGSRDSKSTDVSSSRANDPGKQTLGSGKVPPMLAIGFSVFFVALALIILAACVHRRNEQKRKANEEEQRPSEHTEQPPIDPDDVVLLSVDEKMDMRSLESEGHSMSTASDSAGERNSVLSESFGDGI